MVVCKELNKTRQSAAAITHVLCRCTYVSYLNPRWTESARDNNDRCMADNPAAIMGDESKNAIHM